MRGRILLGPALLLSLAMALAGCGGGGGGDEITWSGTGIHGYVTAGRGDNALAGVTVELYIVTEVAGTYIPLSLPDTPDRSTITGSTGYYRFADLAPGNYLLQVKSTSRAGARYQHLRVTQDQRVRADLILFPNFVRAEGAGAELPYITSLELVEGENGTLLQGDEILSGTVSLRVAAQAGATDLPIKQILVKIGHLSNGSDETFDAGEAIATFNVDTTEFGNGPTFIYITAYDKNDNAASVKIPVAIDNRAEEGLPLRPEVVRVEAWTFAEPYGIKSMTAGTARVDLPPLRVMVDGKPIYLPQTSSLNAGVRAIGAGGSAMVHIQIKPDDSATSYRIYRRFGTSGSYQLIGERVNDEAYCEDAYTDGVDWRALWFNDLDPALQVKQDYYYRVAAVNAAGERYFEHELRVMILPRFTAYLQSPLNGDTISLAANPKPVFTWTADGGYGTTNNMGFVIYVLNKNDEGLDTVPFSWVHMVHGAKSARYGDLYESGVYSDDYDLKLPGVPARPLVPNALYEWDLLLAYSVSIYAGMNLGESYAASYSFPRINWKSSNGAFSFTTAP